MKNEMLMFADLNPGGASCMKNQTWQARRASGRASLPC